MRRKERLVTDREQIEAILLECKVCRLGLNDNGKVYIVPLNYGYCMEDKRLVLYFHCAGEGRKLDVIRANPSVGFEMDCNHGLQEGTLACQYSYCYASMIGNGQAEIITDSAEKRKALHILMKHMTGKDFQELDTDERLERMVSIIKVTVEEYACKRHQ